MTLRAFSKTSSRPARGRHHQLGALLLVVLMTLTGCATGTPAGIRVPASTFAQAASLDDGEDCGEPVEPRPSAESVPTPVKLDEAQVREALAGLVLQLRLSVGSRVVPASASGGGEAVDRLFQHVWRDKGLWCQPGQSPKEDGCLSLLEHGFSLDAFERLKLAVGFSMDTVLDGVAVAVNEAFSPKVLAGIVAGFLASYVLMLATPEPVFTKGLALLLTVYLAVYLGTGPFRRLVLASRELVGVSKRATTFAELEEAGHRFGLVLGEDGARVVLLLIMAALGGQQGLLRQGPTLPGFAQAAAVAESELGLRLLAVADVQSVAITASGRLVLGLAPTAMAMVTQGPGGDTARPAPAKTGYWHHIATDKFFKSTRNGGPWSPRFKAIFDRAGMKMSDPANKVFIRGHKGPHPQAYHQAVYRRLSRAVSDCANTQQCKEALTRALQELAQELSTPGSTLNRLISG